VELFIGRLLRIGVIAAACVAVAGGVVFLARHGAETPRYETFRGEPAFLQHVTTVVQSAVAGRTTAVIQLGLLLLIAVPILRVAVSIVAFVLERDWIYCGVTALVLAILLFALLGGRI
jgi:uncharacterized membrane protein